MLSIIIPACNASGAIARTLEDYISYFKEHYGQHFEIVVVVNGCSDDTADIVQGYCDRFPMVRALVFAERMGKGGAVIEGFKATEGQVVGYVDADGATVAEELFKLVESMGDNQVVIASRWLPGARMVVKQSLARRLASRCFNMLVRLLFGFPFKDTQCGAKVFTRQAVEDVLPDLKVTQFAFDIELLYKLKARGHTMVEVPTVWRDQPRSTLNLWKVAPEMFWAVLKIRLLNLCPKRGQG